MSKSVDEVAREVAEKIVNAFIGDKRDFADEYEKTLAIIAPYLADEQGVWEKCAKIAETKAQEYIDEPQGNCSFSMGIAAHEIAKAIRTAEQEKE